MLTPHSCGVIPNGSFFIHLSQMFNCSCLNPYSKPLLLFDPLFFILILLNPKVLTTEFWQHMAAATPPRSRRARSVAAAMLRYSPGPALPGCPAKNTAMNLGYPLGLPIIIDGYYKTMIGYNQY